jgi:hypothetical protein
MVGLLNFPRSPKPRSECSLSAAAQHGDHITR